jgi:hypothetical protein
MAFNSPILTGKDLADVFDMTPQSVSRMAKDQIIKKNGRGKYDLASCAKQYIQYLRKTKIKSDAEEAAPDYHKEKARDTKLQADLREIELEEKRGNLIPVEAYTDEILEIAQIFASGIESLSGRLASDCHRAESAAEVQTLILEETRRIRIATAERLQRHAEDVRERANSLVDSHSTETPNS